jgi:hypothetical protein
MIDPKEFAQEYIKCYADKSRIYFIEKFLSTFDGTEGKDVPFVLFPRQKVYCQALADSEKVVTIKHRQCGISTVSCGWITGQITFSKPDSPETVLCLANKKEQAQELLKKIVAFLEQVPRQFWGDEYYSPDPKSEKNSKSIFIKNSQSYVELFNGCKIYCRASSENAARGISSVSIVIFDEAAFIGSDKKGLAMATYSSAIACTSSVLSRKIIMVSTPNGKDELYYNTYKQAIEKKNGYTVVEFKWFQDPRYNRFLRWYKKNDETGEEQWIQEKTIDEAGRIEFNMERWEQLEREGWKPTSPWYVSMCQAMNNDPMKIAQELDISFLGSSDNVVPAAVIEEIRTSDVCEPLAEFADPAEENTWFWKMPIEGHRYIVAIDPSVGSSDDRTSIQVIDADGVDQYGMPYLEQIMEYNGRVLGDKLGDMAYKYGTLYNNALIVVDATGGTGDACLLRLKNYWGYKNLYYDDKVMKEYMRRVERSDEKFADRMPGFHFQGNRFPLLRNFANMVTDRSFTIHSVRLCNELDTWIFKNEDGKMDHMNGAHDDNITCCAMALFIYKFSYQKLEATKSRDAAILKAFVRTSGGYQSQSSIYQEGTTVSPKNNVLPFYSSRYQSINQKIARIEEHIANPYVWLMAGYG